MVMVSDPIGERLITSFARPGANVTGLALIPTLEIYAKQLQLLKEAVPHAQRIALLRNPANPAAAQLSVPSRTRRGRCGSSCGFPARECPRSSSPPSGQ